MAASTYLNQVQQLYIAYFGRPADPIGQQYWAQVIDSAGGNISSVLAGFSASAESTALYGTSSTAQKVAAIYSNVFNRAPEAAGLAYWINLIDSGQVTQAQAAWAIQQAAGPGDASVVNNKLIAANDFTANLDTNAELLGYNGATSASIARAYLNKVDATYQSISDLSVTLKAVADATGTGTATVPLTTLPSSPPTAQTFTLTIGTDTVTGTSLNDAINGTVILSNSASPINSGTFQTADVITGGAGVDTLNITISGGGSSYSAGALPQATVSAVETVNLHAIQAETSNRVTVDASTFSGLTSINSDRSTSQINLTKLAAGTAVGVIGDGSTVNGNVLFEYADRNASPVINISGGTRGGNIFASSTSSDITSATLNFSGAANTLGSVALNATLSVATVYIHANSDVTITSLSGFASNGKVIIDGSASRVSLGFYVNSLKNLEVDASGLTAGGVTTDLGVMVSTFKGSAGSDLVTTSAAAVSSAAAIDAGAGTDRLIVTSALSNTTALYYKGFEELQLNNLTQDVSLFNNSSISKLILSDGAVVQNASVAQASNIQIMSSGAYNIGVSGASNNPSDTVHITADDGVATTSTITLSNLNIADVEILQLTAIDNLVVSSVANAPALASIKLDGAGTIGLTTGALSFVTGSSIDASTATGAVSINASAATGNGLTIKGGAGDDTITGSSKADVLTGGAGVDAFIFGASTRSTLADMDTITDFKAATGDNAGAADVITITDIVTVASNVNTVQDLSAQTSLSNALNIIANAATTNNGLSVFKWGGNTYAYIETTGATSTYVAGDTVIKLGGTPFTPGTSIVGLGIDGV